MRFMALQRWGCLPSKTCYRHSVSRASIAPFQQSKSRKRSFSHHLWGPWTPGLLALCAIHAPGETEGLLLDGKAAEAAPQASPKGRQAWRSPFSLQTKQPSSAASEVSSQPQTITDVTSIVAANTPVFFFHDQEQYFPCTVEWFLERSRLVRVAKGWKRKVLEVLVDYGMLDGSSLAQEQQQFNKDKKSRRRQFLQLELEPCAREGQPVEDLNKVPIYAHVKQTLDPLLGKRDGIEINYMKFLAYNGPYKLFHSIWIGPLGAHDADWEHVTVRLTPDGGEVVGVYYSAHRHRDGCWRSADDVPLSESGRPYAYIAENGHGSYPVAGTILRLFCVINDYTSEKGRKWDPEEIVLVTQTDDDKLPSVVSRGSSLNGSSYRSPIQKQHSNTYPKVRRQNAPWLRYEGKWGSSVEAPQRQEWYVRAENPISRTWLQQIFFPLLPGVESIWEPAREEVEEAVEKLRSGVDEGMEAFKDAAEDVQKELENSRKLAYKRWRELVKDLKKRSSRDE